MSKYCPQYGLVLYLDCLECELKYCRGYKDFGMEIGDIVELKFNDKKLHLLYCGLANVKCMSNKLFYSLDKHKESGFSYKHYERYEDRLLSIYKIRIIKSKGEAKGTEYRIKWQKYFDKLK